MKRCGNIPTRTTRLSAAERNRSSIVLMVASLAAGVFMMSERFGPSLGPAGASAAPISVAPPPAVAPQAPDASHEAQGPVA